MQAMPSQKIVLRIINGINSSIPPRNNAMAAIAKVASADVTKTPTSIRRICRAAMRPKSLIAHRKESTDMQA